MQLPGSPFIVQVAPLPLSDKFVSPTAIGGASSFLLLRWRRLRSISFIATIRMRHKRTRRNFNKNNYWFNVTASKRKNASCSTRTRAYKTPSAR